MATYHVVCITKKPTHDDPHERIQKVGTSSYSTSAARTRMWTTDEVISAIEGGDVFICKDKKGDHVRVEVKKHEGRKYIKTENDSIKQDNLLWQDDC